MKKSEDAVSRDEIELLAFKLWERRGSPFGSPELDWFEAEEMLIERQAGKERSSKLSGEDLAITEWQSEVKARPTTVTESAPIQELESKPRVKKAGGS